MSSSPPTDPADEAANVATDKILAIIGVDAKAHSNFGMARAVAAIIRDAYAPSIAALEAQRDRLAETLPRYADGPVMPLGSAVFYDNSDRNIPAARCMSDDAIVEFRVFGMGWGADAVSLLASGSSISVAGETSKCYSTRAAAEAAQRPVEVKP